MKKVYSLFICAAFFCAVGVSAAPLSKAPKKLSALAGPVVKPATDITATGFTANWSPVAGAETYTLNVYEPITVPDDGTYAVLQEDFSLISKGSIVEPYYYDEGLIAYLDELDWAFTPDWSVYLPVFAKGMLAGIIYSPYIDLTNDGGRYRLVLGITGYQGAEIQVETNGVSADKRVVTLASNGYNEVVLDFENGSHDTYFTVTDMGIPDDPDQQYIACVSFLDDVSVVQDLRAGDLVLRPVQCVETSETSHRFDDLKYRYNATVLAYDVQGNVVTFNDPDDPWDYDVEYTEFSQLEYVRLVSGVDDVAVDNDGEAEYFNLQGVRVTGELAPGIYIRRQGGISAKIMVK